MNYRALIRPNILSLEPYRCARDDFKEGILLDANENTHGPALENASELELQLNRYPDPHQIELKKQIISYRNQEPNKHLQAAEKNALVPENLCLGVGSDESIDLLLRCVCRPGQDKLLVCPPTYGMYSVCATVNDVSLVKVPLKFPGFQLDVDEIMNALLADSSIRLVYLTSPGNPTGTLLNSDDIVYLADSLKSKWNGLVVVDEAYIDFAASDVPGQGASMCTLVNEYPNLVVLQTLSKAFGLAGIRLGITYSDPELSKYLNAMKYPYNISSLTAEVALRATDPKKGLSIMKKYVASIIEQRNYVLSELSKIPGIGKNIGGHDSNFVLVEILDKYNKPSNEIAFKLYEHLATLKSVVVRFRGKELNCNGCLRISIGTAEENKILISKIRDSINKVRN